MNDLQESEKMSKVHLGFSSYFLLSGSLWSPRTLLRHHFFSCSSPVLSVREGLISSFTARGR